MKNKNPLVERFAEEPRWVNWEYAKRKGKMTKMPITLTGNAASSTDPKTWSTYDQVMACDPEKIGIVFTSEKKLLGIDIDKCIVDGKMDPKVEQFIKECDTYTEISPSGTGVHLFFELTEPLILAANRHEHYECYTEGRYFTVTGKVYHDAPIKKIDEMDAQFNLQKIGYPWGNKKKDEVFSKENEARVSLLEAPPATYILDKMFAARNGAEIQKLYNGDISDHGDDYSRADMALLNHLAFWCGKDAARMEEIWLASPLGKRKKTQERADYRQRSIAAAISHTTEVYTPRSERGESEVTMDDLDLMYTFKGKGEKVYYKNTENVARLLNRHPQFKGTFQFDEYKGYIFRKIDGRWRPLKDWDALDVQTKISVLFEEFANVGKEMVYDAILKVAYDNKIDSGADYIRSLKWDGTERLSKWLHIVYGTPADEYHTSVGSNWLKGLVKRITDPGCKFDYVLVLEGKQGIRKSTSLAILAGILGHVETVVSSEQKDFFLQMLGNAIIEFSEGETLSRSEVKHLKSVISTATDKYRAPYGKATEEHPRRCVFAMTTNQTEYLKDETGNRRWLPVSVTKMADVEWLKENREQLLAEAYAKIVKGETTHEFSGDLEEQQEARRVRDPNTDLIVNWYWTQPQGTREAGVTTTDVYVHALHGGFATREISRAIEMSISDVLKNQLKLDSKRVMINGARSMRYFPTEKTLQLQPEQMPFPVNAF